MKKFTFILIALIAMTTLRNQAQTTVTDYDGNVYNTVTIGTQAWMKENLKVTHYRNGTLIPNVIDTAAWRNLVTSARCYYNNDSVLNAPVYGTIYNWYAVNDSSLCPIGWHVATDNEWTTLITYLGGDSVAAGKLKEIGTTHWQSPNAGATNITGFTALGGGLRRYDGVFDNMGHDGYWWSSTEYSTDYSWNMNMRKYDSTVFRQHFGKTYGSSVRCLKGSSTTQINEIIYPKEIKIYPNPAIDRIYISFSDRQDINNSSLIINIYDVVGKLISSETLQQNQQQISTSNLNNGIYFVEIKSNEWSKKQKLIIQR